MSRSKAVYTGIVPEDMRPFTWTEPGLSRAQRVINFVQFLKITKGIRLGKQLELLPFQREFIEAVYTDDHRVRQAILSAPRGQGKTSLTAALALAHLIGPESEMRGEIVSAASDTQQAAIVFAEMLAITSTTPEFRQFRITSSDFYKKMTVTAGPSAGSTYTALSSESKRGHGLSPSLWIFDEMGLAPDRKLYDALQTAAGKRDNTLGLLISTQAPDSQHVFSEVMDDALKAEDPSIVVRLICARDDEDPFAEETIRRVNPALGIFLNEREIMAAAKQAERNPNFEPSFRNLRLNQRVAIREDRAFVTPQVWELGNRKIDEAELYGRECDGGLDLSAKHDLTALTLVVPVDKEHYAVVHRYWAPLGTMDMRTQAERETIENWMRQGYIIPIDAPVIRLDFVAAEIAKLAEKFKIRRINYDRCHVADLKVALDDIGCNVNLEEFGQGFMSMGPATARLLELAAEGRILHGGHPVLAAAAYGACVKLDPAGNMKLDKGASTRTAVCRIDPIVALVMAVGGKREPEKKFQLLWI
jgi:phage terminase large subunit-like protein